MWKVYILMFIVVLGIALLWVKGITDMHEKHPDYKGDDFNGGFDFDDKDENRKDYNEE